MVVLINVVSGDIKGVKSVFKHDCLLCSSWLQLMIIQLDLDNKKMDEKVLDYFCLLAENPPPYFVYYEDD